MSTPFDPVQQFQSWQAPTPTGQALQQDPQMAAMFQAWLAQQAAAQAAPPAPQYQGAYTQPPAPQFAAPPAPAPAVELPVGTLADFYNQPQSANGKSVAFDEIGDTYVLRVSRKVVDGDVRAQTNDSGQPAYYQDGRAKLVLVLPVAVYQKGTAMTPLAGLPGGPEDAALWVKGKDWASLSAAMVRAGHTGQLPEEGSFIKVVFTKKQKNRAPMADTKVKDFQYMRPDSGSVVEPTTPVAHTPAPVPAALAIDVPPAAAPIPPAGPAANPVAPVGLTPEMAAKLAELTGGK